MACKRPMEALSNPSTQESLMPSKIRRTSTAAKVKAYRAALTAASLLVLLEALGAPRKL